MRKREMLQYCYARLAKATSNRDTYKMMFFAVLIHKLKHYTVEDHLSLERLGLDVHGI